MTNEEAIRNLDAMWKMLTSAYDEIADSFVVAYTMAVDALKAQTDGDTISRQAAIELIERMKPYHQDADDIAEMIANMPSAQPDTDRIYAELSKAYNVNGLPDEAIGIIGDLMLSLDEPSAQPEPSQVARDIATIIENEQDMRVILKNAQPEIIRKPVVGYEGYYEVDTCGRIYSLDRIIHVEDNGRTYDKPLKGGIMKQHMHSHGYKIVSLTKDGKSKNVFVHRIVATAFLPNPKNLPCINHKDEDKTNNFVENLEWCTYQYNNAYGSKPKKHSKWMSGRKLSDEHKQHISDGHRRHWDKVHAERRTNES